MVLRTIVTTFFLGMSLLTLGCGSDDGETSADAEAASAFEAGSFQLTTHAASDLCLDGGLNILFMPEGQDTPYDLAYPTELPGVADLPTEPYTIKLQEPFTDMVITVVKAGDNMEIADSEQADVLVDEEAYGDCKADMIIAADITIVDNNNVDVAAQITISEISSEADGKCPSPPTEEMTPPCQVELTMKGRRL